MIFFFPHILHIIIKTLPRYLGLELLQRFKLRKLSVDLMRDAPVVTFWPNMPGKKRNHLIPLKVLSLDEMGKYFPLH